MSWTSRVGRAGTCRGLTCGWSEARTFPGGSREHEYSRRKSGDLGRTSFRSVKYPRVREGRIPNMRVSLPTWIRVILPPSLICTDADLPVFPSSALGDVMTLASGVLVWAWAVGRMRGYLRDTDALGSCSFFHKARNSDHRASVSVWWVA